MQDRRNALRHAKAPDRSPFGPFRTSDTKIIGSEMGRKLSDNSGSIQRKLEIEAALAEYGDLPADRIVDLVGWFRREATAREIATIAGNPAIADNYQHFRALHLVGMTTGGAVLCTFIGAVLIVVLAVAAAVA